MISWVTTDLKIDCLNYNSFQKWILITLQISILIFCILLIFQKVINDLKSIQWCHEWQLIAEWQLISRAKTLLVFPKVTTDLKSDCLENWSLEWLPGLQISRVSNEPLSDNWSQEWLPKLLLFPKVNTDHSSDQYSAYYSSSKKWLLISIVIAYTPGLSKSKNWSQE